MGNRISYNDYPDGTHCLYKTACVTKNTSVLGFWLATLDVINYTKPDTLGGALARYPRYMVPGVFSGLVFGLTACTLTMVRQKDDQWNYLFAGGAMGSVFGIARRSFAVGTPCTVFFAFAAFCYKEYIHSEAAKVPVYKNWNGTFDSMTHDYTLTPERPKYTPDRPSFI